MLSKCYEAVEWLKKSDHKDSFTSVECWKKEEQEYNLYVFSATLENELELERLWKELTNAVAVFFQSELEKEIEIWNIYLIFIIKEKVSRDIKYKVEQDKYSTRKIVIDNIKDTSYIADGNYSDLIESRLFAFRLPEQDLNKNTNTDNKSLLDIISEKDKKLCDVIINNSQDKPSTQFVKYLG